MHDTLCLLMVPVLALSACGDDGTIVPSPARDTIPPAVVALSPAPGDTGVSLQALVEVTFSEPLNWATLGPASFYLLRQLEPVAGSYSAHGSTAVFHPDVPLDSVTWYDVTVTSAGRDSAGNRLPADTSWSFRTGTPQLVRGGR